MREFAGMSSRAELNGLRNIAVSLACDPLTPLCVAGDEWLELATIKLRRLGDAHDEPDTGGPPCLFCRRVVPCECAGAECMCSCGRCMAEPLPVYRADSPPS